MLLVLGVDDERALVGDGQPITVSRSEIDRRWLGSYLVAWPQASGWPAEIGLGDNGSAALISFEHWLKGFQMRNGLEPDGIVGRHTLLYLITASIDEPELKQTWD